MDHGRPRDARGNADDVEITVSSCETRPGRVVFTDESDTDAWIATDLVVEVER